MPHRQHGATWQPLYPTAKEKGTSLPLLLGIKIMMQAAVPRPTALACSTRSAAGARAVANGSNCLPRVDECGFPSPRVGVRPVIVFHAASSSLHAVGSGTTEGVILVAMFRPRHHASGHQRVQASQALISSAALSSPFSAPAMADDGRLLASLDLMRRMPPSRMENSLEGAPNQPASAQSCFFTRLRTRP